MFLLTDNNKTWNNIELIPNQNYQNTFSTYPSLNLAKFLYPAYEGLLEIPIAWEVSSNEFPIKSDGIINYYSSVITLQPIKIELPTLEQRILFAILVSTNVVQNPLFLKWLKIYLNKSDCKETKTLADTLYELYEINLAPEHQYYNCLHPLLFGILNNKIEYFAYSVTRAFYDFPNLNLNKIANIALNLNKEEIKEILLN